MKVARVESSFRDPSGFVFQHEGVLYRQVNESYRDNYELLMSSGLYDSLSSEGLLVPHAELPHGSQAAPQPAAFRVLRPERVPLITYPYCWTLGQLRDAALLVIEIQRRALAHGMTLKDASAFNIQWFGTRPVLIDTLSFERRTPGAPWMAYRQFCQHFLAPLLLMSRRDPRLAQLLRVHLDGVPLDLASALLPKTTWLRFSTLLHIHLHARSLRRWADTPLSESRLVRPVSDNAMLGLLDNLERAVQRLRWSPDGTQWARYEREHNYSDAALERKRALVAEWLNGMSPRPRTVWDLGANTGSFSRIAAKTGAQVLAIDADAGAAELHYRRLKAAGESRIVPIVMDLTNPSPGLGWAGREWASFESRGPADVLLALALVHHLAIGNNVPLEDIASWFSRLGTTLVCEFITKNDPQAQRLLGSRRDIFDSYTRSHFERAFAGHFRLAAAEEIGDSGRILYLMTRK